MKLTTAVTCPTMKVCWDEDETRARQTGHRLWPNDGLPGELAQILPTPAHFEQASELVSEHQIAESIPCGPDLAAHLQKIREFEDAGFDELYVQQVGDGHDVRAVLPGDPAAVQRLVMAVAKPQLRGWSARRSCVSPEHP
jgi:hypothetical protein